MKYSGSILLGSVTLALAAEDIFNYHGTAGNDYGPEDWDRVTCDNLATCPGWPDKFEGSIGWRPTSNQCQWCPESGNSCGQHRQSPIELMRDRAIPGSPEEKECPDWHWIQYLDGTCSWDDMANSFSITRNTLSIDMPVKSNGDLDCVDPTTGERKFPKLDYSKGFPDWWYLSRTDITVPSEHYQHGQRYAAEIKLNHFYEIDHYKNKMGIVSFFMQDFDNEPSWPYLDKLICKWREEEEKRRSACGMDPAPVYKMCELYRGQTRTAADMEAPTAAVIVPTRAPLVAPPAIPVQNFGGDPEEFRLPLGLCQGDCDFTDDCAPGLICFRRNAFDEVPGCIGGNVDETNTDYCVFDPWGTGYEVPTPEPTGAPTITARPTISAVAPQPLLDMGGTPPADMMPLKICQGDCDKDDDCATGLICFQRTSFEPVPGCIGGETDPEKTDYCILDPYGPGYNLPASTPAFPVDPLAPTVSPTVHPRPTGAALQIQNLGWEPPVPLGECAGDCDVDEDCGPGMYCYQRNSAYESVPGCLGGDADPSLTDYCTYAPLPAENSGAAPSPTKNPTLAPVAAAPTGPAATLPNITIVGWSPQVKLNECEGDCDDDADCADGLTCFQRNRANLEVPGCLGGAADNTLTDYCIKDAAAVGDKTETGSGGSSTAVPMVPTSSPTKATTGTSPVAVDNGSDPPLEDLGWTPPAEMKPLGRCQGDCDIRQDCGPGLDCYQRYLPNLPVPGCSGGENDSSLTDYCVPEELINLSPPTAPGSSTTAPASPTKAPTAPTKAPTAPTKTPSSTSQAPVSPTLAPGSTSIAPAQGGSQPPVDNRIDNSTSLVSGIPPPISCDQHSDVNFLRMCRQDSCCTNPRSTTEFCQESYRLLGDNVESACYHCCLEQQGKAETVGPAPEVNPDIPKLLECDAVDQPDRMCRPNSCCTENGKRSSFCQGQYAKYSHDEIESICWYCCFPSQTVGFDTRRALASSEAKLNKKTKQPDDVRAAYRQLLTDETIGEYDKMTHDVNGRPIIVRAENFEEKGMMDEDAYFQELLAGYRERALQDIASAENYDDVSWWPYEWFLKVGTEYYFRYEGTETVPPCYDTAHWRVFKDPIRVASHQMRELERLIAWRLSDDKCEVDTAGKSDGNPNYVEVARPLQSFHRLHRMVFCECQDWPSKFPADRQWCRNWKNMPPEDRLIENPYNWPSDGFAFLPPANATN